MTERQQPVVGYGTVMTAQQGGELLKVLTGRSRAGRGHCVSPLFFH